MLLDSGVTAPAPERSRRPSREEIRATYKRPDAWWPVIFTDPIASLLLRVVTPIRVITPNGLTLTSFGLGLGTAAAFAMQTRWWLVVGALGG